ncbi:hypothetical protein F0L74_27755 [Chitinophaga agrisoli]|uniref:Uncharacterized protein n=2 Tax=Chitinophaga agrisoli TaxID=2607653 RepID=A0A5B2VPF9_9BACT|nr:hypothetical protein F0L74_27755 [Chitinophaga agrisoli]
MNLNNATDPVVVPLPYFDGSFIINMQFLTGGIGLIANEDLSSYEDENGVAYQQARYVIIPADAAARKAAGIDWNDYKQVKKYLNLKD